MRSHALSTQSILPSIERGQRHSTGVTFSGGATSLIMPPRLSNEAVDLVWEGRLRLCELPPDRPTLAKAVLLLRTMGLLPDIPVNDLHSSSRLQCHVNGAATEWASKVNIQPALMQTCLQIADNHFPAQRVARWLGMLMESNKEHRQLAMQWMANRAIIGPTISAVSSFVEQSHAAQLARCDMGLGIMLNYSEGIFSIIPDFVAFQFDTTHLSAAVADLVRWTILRIDEVARPLATPQSHGDHFGFIHEEFLNELEIIEEYTQAHSLNPEGLSDEVFSSIITEEDLNFISSYNEYLVCIDKQNSLELIRKLWDMERLNRVNLPDAETLSPHENLIATVCNDILDELQDVEKWWREFQIIDGKLLSTPIIFPENLALKDDFQYAYEEYMNGEDVFGNFSLHDSPDTIMDFIRTFALGGRCLIRLYEAVETQLSNTNAQETP